MAPQPLDYANLAVRGKLLDQVVVEQLPAALARARDVVVKEKRQALLNVVCPP